MERAEKGRPTPAWDNRPELYEDLEPVWEAFTHLNARRQGGMGPSPISMEAIVAYFELRRLSSQEMRMEWYRLICLMDGVWLKWQNEKLKAK